MKKNGRLCCRSIIDPGPFFFCFFFNGGREVAASKLFNHQDFFLRQTRSEFGSLTEINRREGKYLFDAISQTNLLVYKSNASLLNEMKMRFILMDSSV